MSGVKEIRGKESQKKDEDGFFTGYAGMTAGAH